MVPDVEGALGGAHLDDRPGAVLGERPGLPREGPHPLEREVALFFAGDSQHSGRGAGWVGDLLEHVAQLADLAAGRAPGAVGPGLGDRPRRGARGADPGRLTVLPQPRLDEGCGRSGVDLGREDPPGRRAQGREGDLVASRAVGEQRLGVRVAAGEHAGQHGRDQIALEAALEQLLGAHGELVGVAREGEVHRPSWRAS